MAWCTSGRCRSNHATYISSVGRVAPQRVTNATFTSTVFSRIPPMQTNKQQPIIKSFSLIPKGLTASPGRKTQTSSYSALGISTTLSWMWSRWYASTRRRSGTQLIWSSSGASSSSQSTLMGKGSAHNRFFWCGLWGMNMRMHLAFIIWRRAARLVSEIYKSVNTLVALITVSDHCFFSAPILCVEYNTFLYSCKLEASWDWCCV